MVVSDRHDHHSHTHRIQMDDDYVAFAFYVLDDPHSIHHTLHHHNSSQPVDVYVLMDDEVVEHHHRLDDE